MKKGWERILWSSYTLISNHDGSSKKKWVKVQLCQLIPSHTHHSTINITTSREKQSRRKQRKDTEIPQSSGPTEPIADEVVNEENVPTQSNDPPLSRVNTLGSGEDKLKLKELINLCTKLSNRVTDLETKQRRLSKEMLVEEESQKAGRKGKLKLRMKRLFQDKLYWLMKLRRVVEEVIRTAEVSAAAIITIEVITLAQALAELRSAKPKVVVQEPVQSTTKTAPSTIPRAKGIVFHEQEQAPTPIVSSQEPTQVKDKGKGKIVEEEPVKKMSKKELLKLDEELAFKLQAERRRTKQDLAIGEG
ncbi:hypothetical protein Tco_0180535 [Tanacetum coccineum]